MDLDKVLKFIRKQKIGFVFTQPYHCLGQNNRISVWVWFAIGNV